VKGVIGQPTKYQLEVLDKVGEYVSMTGKENMSLPTMGGLALHLGVSRRTLFDWRKRYPQFKERLEQLLNKQKQQLMDDGMYGGKEVNVGMAIFLLKTNHGMQENDPSTLVQINFNKDRKEFE